MAAREASFRRDVLHASEKDLVRLACVIAERVAHRELRTDPELVVGWVREAIECLAAKESVIVALGSEMAIRLSSVDWGALVGDFVYVETDAALGAWQCEVRVGAATVDCSIDRRLAVVSTALGGQAP
jgi:flagellar biosynthesis/type III secretory pathway protein FliH